MVPAFNAATQGAYKDRPLEFLSQTTGIAKISFSALSSAYMTALGWKWPHAREAYSVGLKEILYSCPVVWTFNLEALLRVLVFLGIITSPECTKAMALPKAEKLEWGRLARKSFVSQVRLDRSVSPFFEVLVTTSSPKASWFIGTLGNPISTPPFVRRVP